MGMAKVLAMLPGVAGSSTDKATAPTDPDGAPRTEQASSDTDEADSDEGGPAEDHLRLLGHFGQTQETPTPTPKPKSAPPKATTKPKSAPPKATPKPKSSPEAQSSKKRTAFGQAGPFQKKRKRAQTTQTSTARSQTSARGLTAGGPPLSWMAVARGCISQPVRCSTE